MEDGHKELYIKEKFNNIGYMMLKSITDCIYEAVCVIDEHGIVIVWNKSAEKLYNIAYEKIIGRNIENFFDDAMVNNVRKTGVPIENKYHCPLKNHPVLANSMPLYIENVFRGAVSTDRDFEELSRLYSELENANSKLIFLENQVKKNLGIFGNIIGKSSSIVKKIDMARQIAPTNSSVMITGESGTGKEVFAKGIHELSGRKGLFVPVNCSAIPSELFESEFFGYCSGAFTGANRKGKIGIFELANEGTVFLDEIGDMPLSMQAKLLRVLQEREIVRVGGEKSIKLNLRVISATNKSLQEMVKINKFREDLYYRLNVVEINLPPLRDRKEDIPLFIDHFIKEFSAKNSKNIIKIHGEVMNILNQYKWPGNIRELMNVIEHIVVTNKNGIIQKNSIPEYILLHMKENEFFKEYPLDLTRAIRELEIENIKKALKITKNNKSKAAKLLNIPRGTLYHKIDEYKIKKI
ncbi:sigma-54-dependent Fis family transcriptional regulator [Clostridium drakei]|uniref:Sigma-54-dependent Fis family transcriptional regulator n=1 Tax=Clostridium drakei TaxID=332101 RepID=A0A2U8DWR9_9CLOT|nr:sigma-54-dependent Fis family transcriptional regulator [Clostridium drakei]AWI07099.1 sigma-54-dependent Fis family transcriptional regulator [Clostridium drakei]